MTIPYVAGLLDGEGSISLLKHSTGRSRRPQLCIAMSEVQPLEAAKEIIGGFISIRRKAEGRKKIMHDLRLGGKPAQEVLEELRPYLVIQRRQRLADLVIEKWKPGPPGKHPQAMKAKEVLFTEMKEANSNRLTEVPWVPTVEPSRDDVSYLAGILDGEGHITPQLKIEVYSTDPELLAWCRSRFGGNVYLKKKTRKECRPIWVWARSPTGNMWATEAANQMLLPRKSDLLRRAQGFKRTPGIKSTVPYEVQQPDKVALLLALVKEGILVAPAARDAEISISTARKVVKRTGI